MSKEHDTIQDAIEMLNYARSIFFANHSEYGCYKRSDFNRVINSLIDNSTELEEQEAKTCDGCIHSMCSVKSFAFHSSFCMMCSREKYREDYYETKDNL